MKKKENNTIVIAISRGQLETLETLPDKKDMLYDLLICIARDEKADYNPLMREFFNSMCVESKRVGKLLEKKEQEMVVEVPIEDRKREFAVSLATYIGTGDGRYPRPFIKDFYDYWTQPSGKTGKKMLFEKERDARAFEINLRLATSWRMHGERLYGSLQRDGKVVQKAETKGEKGKRIYDELMEEIKGGNYGQRNDDNGGEAASLIDIQ